MSKVYMLTFDDLARPRDALLRFIDSRPEVSNWHASTLHNLVLIVSDRSGEELTNLLRERMGMDTFMLIEVDSEMVGRQIHGWLPESTWAFIREKPIQPELRLTASS